MDDTAAGGVSAIDLTAEIVGAFISNNSVRPSDLPALIANVHAAVAGLSNGNAVAAPAGESKVQKPTPAQIRKSITPDALISFIDGKPYKTLKRHLGRHGLDFAAYLNHYGLPSDYPAVAPNYSAARSAIAKNLGLGKGRSRAATPAAAKAAAPSPAVSVKPKRVQTAKKVV